MLHYFSYVVVHTYIPVRRKQVIRLADVTQILVQIKNSVLLGETSAQALRHRYTHFLSQEKNTKKFHHRISKMNLLSVFSCCKSSDVQETETKKEEETTVAVEKATEAVAAAEEPKKEPTAEEAK